MNIINKIAALLLALLLALPLVPVAITPAKANGVKVSAHVSPSSMPGAGDVEIVVTVENETDALLENINISYTGYTSVMGSLDPGESGSDEGSISVSEGQLGKDIPISVSWLTEGISGSSSTSVRVEKSQQPQETAGKPSVDFSRTPSAKSASPGDKITLTYTVKNNSKQAINNVNITDPATSSTIASGTTINAGESKKFTAEVTVNKDLTSTPKITYEYDGDDYNSQLDALTIAVAKASLTLSATADKSSCAKGESINFTITLKNGGSANISNIKLVDDAGEVIRQSASVNAGKSPTVSHSITFDKSRNVVFTATYQSGGEDTTATSDPIAIKVDGEDAPEGEGKVSIVSVETDPEEPEIPGNVTFKVTISNDGDVTLTNIALNEANLGQMATLGELAPGKTHEFSKITKVTEPGEFKFTIKASDDNGGEYESGTKSISIEGEPVPTETETPSATPEETEAPAQKGDGLKTMLIAIVVIIVLIVIAAIALIVLMVQERRAKKKLEEEGNPDDDDDDPDSPGGGSKENPQQIADAPKRRRPQQEEGARRRPPQQNSNRQDGQPPRRRPAEGEPPRRRPQQPREDLEKTQVIPPQNSDEMYATREIPIVRERLGDIGQNIELDDGYEYEEQPRRRRRPPQDEYEDHPRRRDDYYEDDEFEYEERPRKKRRPPEADQAERPRRKTTEDDLNYGPPKRRRKKKE